MSAFSYVVGAALVIWILLRQVRVRPVPRVLRLTLPLVVGVIGLFEMFSYSGDHHVSSTAWAWVVATLVVGAIGLGLLRGLTVKVWATEHWVLRQGTALTMTLWILSLVVHFVGDAFGTHASGGAGLEGSSFLLYLGLTLGVQNALVHRRALPLWEQLGPDAGSPLQMTFTQAPGTVFTFFRTGGVPPPGGGPPSGSPYDDPNIIDAEVVDDDDHGPPPELPASS